MYKDLVMVAVIIDTALYRNTNKETSGLHAFSQEVEKAARHILGSKNCTCRINDALLFGLLLLP